MDVEAVDMEGADLNWRTQLQPHSRQRITSKILETLKRHLPYCGQEGLHELQNIAVRFEEKIYAAATSQSDYLRKISLKMLTMETDSQNYNANSLQFNAMTQILQSTNGHTRVPNSASEPSSLETGMANMDLSEPDGKI